MHFFTWEENVRKRMWRSVWADRYDGFITWKDSVVVKLYFGQRADRYCRRYYLWIFIFIGCPDIVVLFALFSWLMSWQFYTILLWYFLFCAAWTLISRWNKRTKNIKNHQTIIKIHETSSKQHPNIIKNHQNQVPIVFAIALDLNPRLTTLDLEQLQ